jgi:hypothetical protein
LAFGTVGAEARTLFDELPLFWLGVVQMPGFGEDSIGVGLLYRAAIISVVSVFRHRVGSGFHAD